MNEQESRAAFEAHYRKRIPQGDLIKNGDMHYASRDIQELWIGWQAAIAHAETKQAKSGFVLVPIDLTKDMLDATLAGTVQVQCLTTQMQQLEYLRENYRKQIRASQEQTK